ncbi:unnamed protein product [Prorocentrum cordatum]|uniref:Uncharacterized protein n=1 Tax=Prorocentrum cordatum TaxID=2364126 RepID=A0ABN9WH27_9DINO|nr:unnamed protein product [Polarella glacialis]
MLAALGVLAAGHGDGRRAQAWDPASGFIWGSCGDSLPDEADVTSCDLVDGSSCSDHLSDGPPDADIEVVLGNLPASTSEDPVHLQWWAGFKSEHEYQPLVSAHGAAIYNDMHIAYPKYWEPGFNGGNVRVNESGIAVVRFAAPSTYYVKPYLAWPHVHFRVCKGGAGAAFYYDSLVFAKSVFMVSRSQGSPIVILSLSRYDSDHGVQNYSIPESIGYLSIPSTSTATTLTISTTSVSSVVDFSSDAYSLTATTTATISRPATGSLPEILMSAEMEALTLDALEFSPVYDCLVDGTVFDHFSGSCADACPGDAELQYGQCVLPEIEASSRVTLTASWHLEVHCEELCGLGMENETLHHVRLAVAGHLDVPFQEVARAALTWLHADGRRLSTGARVAVLSVQVETSRHDEVNGLDKLRVFAANPSSIGQLLGMNVNEAHVLPDGAIISGGPTWTIRDDSDPFAVAYEVLLGSQVDGGKQESTADSLLPAGVIVGLAASVVAFGFACGWLLWVFRRRSRRALAANEEVEVPKVAGTAVPKGKTTCMERDAQDGSACQDVQGGVAPRDDAGCQDEQVDDIEI